MPSGLRQLSFTVFDQGPQRPSTVLFTNHIHTKDGEVIRSTLFLHITTRWDDLKGSCDRLLVWAYGPWPMGHMVPSPWDHICAYLQIYVYMYISKASLRPN